jgi:phage internal scaffolding protein
VPEVKHRFQTAYAAHPRVQKDPGGPSLAKQSFAAETNINNILRKYHKTGLLDHVNKHQGDYSDLTLGTDYHENMTALIAAQDAFDSLPSGIRTQFHNDPAEFLEFAQNGENIAEMISLGLATPSQADPAPPTAAPAQEGGDTTPASGPAPGPLDAG